MKKDEEKAKKTDDGKSMKRIKVWKKIVKNVVKAHKALRRSISKADNIRIGFQLAELRGKHLKRFSKAAEKFDKVLAVTQ